MFANVSFDLYFHFFNCVGVFHKMFLSRKYTKIQFRPMLNFQFCKETADNHFVINQDNLKIVIQGSILCVNPICASGKVVLGTCHLQSIITLLPGF